jgi:hypothetical protein
VGQDGTAAAPDVIGPRGATTTVARWPEPSPGTRLSPRAHREQVVRRLLLRGLSPRVLGVLLPEWRPLIERVAQR